VTAERQHILVILPITFHQRDVQALFFEKSLFDRSEDGRFTGEADITDTDFIRLIDGGIRGLVTPAHQQSTQRKRCYQFFVRHNQFSCRLLESLPQFAPPTRQLFNSSRLRCHGSAPSSLLSSRRGRIKFLARSQTFEYSATG